MCARSIGNKLLCGIHHWPDVMDKCQTNALTLLLNQPRRKEITEQQKPVRSVTVGGKCMLTYKCFEGVRQTCTLTLTEVRQLSVKWLHRCFQLQRR